MLDTIQAAPADPILGLSATFDDDPNQNKINLGVGEYRDADGQTPVLQSIRTAEAQRCCRGDDEATLSPRYATIQAPGGTGALRVAGDFVHTQFPSATLWLSEPTLANHPKIFAAAGLPTASYPYYDGSTHGIDFDAMTAALESAQTGDVVLLHGCCHNPTGADLNHDQWQRLGDTVVTKGLLPLVDFAY
jgi:aspartate/tyrosine/aromatic aminotransferase